jgi:CheY-like chemotaxis protein
MVFDNRATHRAESERRRLEPHEAAALTGTRILVVDDNDDTRRLLAIVLEQAGAVAIARESVSAAMKVFEETRVELVITDIQLLQLDGYELMGAIRALPADRRGDVPAIAVSGDTDVHTRKKVERAGFDLFLPKPVGAHELLAAARTVLDARANSR